MFGEDMKFETKIFSIFLILCMLAGVFANSRSDESIFEDFSFFSNKTTLRVWYTDDAITPYLQSMAIKFSEKNREARVEPKLVSGMEYLEAVNKASMENKNLPDIFVTTNDTLEKVYCAGLALEADNSDGFFNKVLFPKAALDSVTYKGKYIAYPFYFETSALVYNKTYLESYAKEQMEKRKKQEEEAVQQETALEEGEESASEGDSAEKTEDSEKATEESSEASSEESQDDESQDEAGEENSGEGEEGEDSEGEDAEDVEIPEEDFSTEEVNEEINDILSSDFKSIQDIINFSRKYDAPEKVKSIFEWDVNDIFYNYFFVGAYMNLGGDAGDNINVDNIDQDIAIYNGNTISCMKIYKQLKQFFAIDAKETTYDDMATRFLKGEILFTIATTDIFKKYDEIKVKDPLTITADGGEYFEYAVAPAVPELPNGLKTRTMSVTNCLVVNGLSEHPDLAEKFARMICMDEKNDIYKMSHKLAAHYGIDYGQEGLNKFVDIYADSVSMPKTIQTSNFWMELEIAFAKIWDDEDADCNAILKELSESIKTQVMGKEYHDQPIQDPMDTPITAGLSEEDEEGD